MISLYRHFLTPHKIIVMVTSQLSRQMATDVNEVIERHYIFGHCSACVICDVKVTLHQWLFFYNTTKIKLLSHSVAYLQLNFVFEN